MRNSNDCRTVLLYFVNISEIPELNFTESTSFVGERNLMDVRLVL